MRFDFCAELRYYIYKGRDENEKNYCLLSRDFVNIRNNLCRGFQKIRNCGVFFARRDIFHNALSYFDETRGCVFGKGTAKNKAGQFIFYSQPCGTEFL